MPHRPRPIPPFKTLEEEAGFWDTHSVADYWNELKPVRVRFTQTKHDELMKKDEENDEDRVQHLKPFMDGSEMM